MYAEDIRGKFEFTAMPVHQFNRIHVEESTIIQTNHRFRSGFFSA